jgi:hypothetical protein
MTVGFPCENFTRAPCELGRSPSPPSRMPASFICIMYLPMSVSICSLGSAPASVCWSALRMIMNRMRDVSL